MAPVLARAAGGAIKLAGALSVVIVWLVAGAAGAHAAARAELPTDFFGVTSEDAFLGDSDYRRSAFEGHAASGVRIVREVFAWSEIEVAPGEYDYRRYDEYVGQAAGAGIKLLPVLFYPPSFRSSAPKNEPDRGVYPPKRYSDMGEFGARLVERYGPRGTFWRDNPSVPRQPIQAWQVWNEPNLYYYWPPGPNAADYAALLRATGQGIKTADPGAEVVAAGVPRPEQWIRDLYAAGARGSFDTLAIHPYTVDEEAPDIPELISILADARGVMQRNRDDSPLWVTEFGWASEGPQSIFRVGEQGQANRIEEALTELAAQREALGLRGAVYYNWRDREPYDGDYWGLHTGLLRTNGHPKAAWFAFAGALDRLQGRPAPAATVRLASSGPIGGGEGPARSQRGARTLVTRRVLRFGVICPGARALDCRGTARIRTVAKLPQGRGRRRARVTIASRRFRVINGRGIIKLRIPAGSRRRVGARVAEVEAIVTTTAGHRSTDSRSRFLLRLP